MASAYIEYTEEEFGYVVLHSFDAPVFQDGVRGSVPPDARWDYPWEWA